MPEKLGERVWPRRAGALVKLNTASCRKMSHYGAREAKFKVKGEAAVMSLGFQVSDVQKPLAAVWRIAEKGNIVQFGPKPEDNFVQNIGTQRKIHMVRKGCSYVIEADFVKEAGF